MSASGSVDVTVDGLVAEYRVWLALERGLASETVRCYGSRAGTFLRWLPEPLESSLPRLDSGRVTSFVLDYCRDHDRGSAQAMVTAVRAVLRFLHLSGRVPRGLAAAVPAVAGWRLASLPRGLDAGVVARLLASCDRSTVGGRRDYAILLLLARLGLRGGEVAGLELGDVDWRGGELTVRGKGGRIDRLPLPVDVGEAIVAYLTDGRPRGPARALFCTVNAPSRRLSAGAVRGVMHSACRRAS
jgi:site-specific recombinase XerC